MGGSNTDGNKNPQGGGGLNACRRRSTAGARLRVRVPWPDSRGHRKLGKKPRLQAMSPQPTRENKTRGRCSQSASCVGNGDVLAKAGQKRCS